MPVDPVNPPGVPDVPGNEQRKDVPAGAPGEIAPPLRSAAPRWGRCRCAPLPRIGNVLPRGRAVVDLLTTSGGLKPLRVEPVK